MAQASDYELLELRIKELEKENSYLRLFKFGMDNMPNARFAIGNRDYCFEAVSKGYFEALNKREDQIVGKPLIEIIGAKMFQEIVKPNFDRALKGEVVNYSTWFELPGSKKRFLNVQYYPVHSKNEINLVAILIQDITEKVQAKKQYQTIIQTAIDGFCLADQQGRLLDVNDSYCKMLGYTREELLQFNFSDIDILRASEETFRQCGIAVKKGQCRLDTKHRCKDGALIDVEINIQYSDLRKGVFICFIRDITEKNKIQEFLKRSEIRYRDLFEGAPMMYVVNELYQGRPMITDCNHQFLVTLGYDREEVIGKYLSEFYTRDSQKKMMIEQNFNRIKENTFTIVERELVCRDGDIVTTLMQGGPEYDGWGNAVGARCMYNNISFQKRAEEQLKESHEMLLTIKDGILDPLYMVDKKMDLVMMNPAAETYFKNHNEACLGKKCHEIFKARLGPCEGCRVSMAMDNGREENFERKGLMNPEVVEQISVYPVRNKDHQVWAAIIRISDITKTRQIEKELVQADKMISLGVLVSGVAHEINNPNNFIMLNTPVLWDAWKGIGPVIEKFYRKNGDFNLAGLPYSRMRDEIPLLFSGMKSGAERIQRIVQDLKNFAQQDDRDMDQPLNINQIIKKSIQLTENLIKEKTMHFKVGYTKCLPSIKGNGQKLEQVMINLIENACQSLPHKERGIFITASFDKKTQSIVVKVRDEGVGIPEKFINRIMDPFFTTKRSEGGTGLGLAVSLNIVKAHGGKIEVASEIAKGSIFRIVIPKIPIKDKALEVEQ
jgi:PAS domain S-box-containing protein